MNNDYEAFCMADPAFYDNPGNAITDEIYVATRREAPHLWQRAEQGNWVVISPEEHELPTQGWKIHVSGCLDNAERIVDAVWAYCVRRHVAFKFLRSPRVVLARNAKYAPRGGSGKLVTVYPRDEAELNLVGHDLATELAGEAGPYILSDLRWGDGPVHVRYGGFAPRYCADDNGAQVLAIADANGTLVPDVRGPVFAVPAWVRPPECLTPHLAARATTRLTDLPYTIEQALHFSNGGGVYAGVDQRSGTKVVLKEARPHAGLSGDGTDAVTRLRREHDALDRLTGIDGVPQLLDYLTIGEHEFLVMTHVDGQPLNGALSQRCPLLDSNLDPEAAAAYAEWAMGVHAEVGKVLAEIHGRGLVYGDLHMFNVLVPPGGGVCLIDFEVAEDVAAGRRPTLGAVGFVAPADRSGFDVDHYALACLRLALFLPLERLISLDRAKAAHLAEVIAEHFPVPKAWLDDAVAVIAGPHAPARTGVAPWRVEPDAASWPRIRGAIGEAILASATPDRLDRLFPGDVLQFEAGGLNLGYGAAGVLYALDVTGLGRYPDHEDWLIRRAHASDGDARLGLYDGLHGVAYVLAHLGHTEEALKLVDRCVDRGLDGARHGDDLHAGLAGMGLNFAHMADMTDELALHDAAERATLIVADRLGAVDSVATTSGGDLPWAGLLRGASGPALLFVRMYERTGDYAYLDLAQIALQQDLRRCVLLERHDQLHVNEGHRTLPYLALGSAGIGLVLRRYLAHRDDEQFATAVDQIRAAAQGLFYVQSGLFNGRAGLILALCDSRPPGKAPSAEVADQVRRLSWHALTYRGQLAFPGDQLLRLSMDLATGGAGVLLALGAALHDSPVHLPFLGPPGAPFALAGAHDRRQMERG